MRALAILLLCFAFSGAVRADEQAKGWLGATVEELFGGRSGQDPWREGHGA